MMRSRNRTKTTENEPKDVGTLWMLQRRELAARCALFAWTHDWEVRVLIDGTPLLKERCTLTGDAFTIAEQWKHRLLSQGWRQVLPITRRSGPAVTRRGAPDAQP